MYFSLQLVVFLKTLPVSFPFGIMVGFTKEMREINFLSYIQDNILPIIFLTDFPHVSCKW